MSLPLLIFKTNNWLFLFSDYIKSSEETTPPTDTNFLLSLKFFKNLELLKLFLSKLFICRIEIYSCFYTLRFSNWAFNCCKKNLKVNDNDPIAKKVEKYI